jgi:hypothetical protein
MSRIGGSHTVSPDAPIELAARESDGIEVAQL